MLRLSSSPSSRPFPFLRRPFLLSLLFPSLFFRWRCSHRCYYRRTSLLFTLALDPSYSYDRTATRFLLSYTGRPCVPILLLFELALLLLRPRVGATLGVPALRRKEKTRGEGTTERENGRKRSPGLIAMATMRWFIAKT